MELENQNNIRWDYISTAVDYYKNNGFKYIEVPWFVSENVINVTLPIDKKPIITQYGPLVGSAEQSFIQLMIDNKLDKYEKYVAVTPCFRDDIVDKYHQKYFIKVELIIYLEKDRKMAYNNRLVPTDSIILTDIAAKLFETLGAKNIKQQLTDDGYDLTLNDIEIGSYGIRNFDDKYWIYGTGLAEPRFSQVLNK